MRKYWYIWSDSESEVELPQGLDHKVFYNIIQAESAAIDFVHQYDNDERRVIVHVEDGLNGETIATYENSNNRCDR